MELAYTEHEQRCMRYATRMLERVSRAGGVGLTAEDAFTHVDLGLVTTRALPRLVAIGAPTPLALSRQLATTGADGFNFAAFSDVLIDTCADLSIHHYEYSRLAARLWMAKLHRYVPATFSAAMRQMQASHVYTNELWITAALTEPSSVQQSAAATSDDDLADHGGLLNREFFRLVEQHADELDRMIDPTRDYTNYDYFAVKTLERSYLVRHPVVYQIMQAAGGALLSSPEEIAAAAPRGHDEVDPAVTIPPVDRGRTSHSSDATTMTDSRWLPSSTDSLNNDSLNGVRPRLILRNLLLVSGIMETPQYMLMRVALSLCRGRLAEVRRTYDLLSRKLYIHATPTLYTAGLRNQTLASCYLISIAEDSIHGICDALTKCALASKASGGVGLNVSLVRARGSRIRGMNGFSNGIVPMLRVFNSMARYVDQGGNRRPGAFAIYLEPWHADIEDFIRLTRRTGDEETIARDIFTAVWCCDLFMRRVLADEMWSLMCPSQSPGLHDAHSAAFERLYTQYEERGQYLRRVPARELWNTMLRSQLETGMPFLLHKDHANRRCNNPQMGVLRGSNLCTEIMLHSDAERVAMCNLASVSLTEFARDATRQPCAACDQPPLVLRADPTAAGAPALLLQPSQPTATTEGGHRPAAVVVHRYRPDCAHCAGGFDFLALYRTVRLVARNLDRSIDVMTYMMPEAERTNKSSRPIGIGVQGLANVFAKLRLAWASADAARLNRRIFETIYRASLHESALLAKRHGRPYDTYERSPAATRGKLQHDLWNDWVLARHRDATTAAATAAAAVTTTDSELCSSLYTELFVPPWSDSLDWLMHLRRAAADAATGRGGHPCRLTADRDDGDDDDDDASPQSATSVVAAPRLLFGLHDFLAYDIDRSTTDAAPPTRPDDESFSEQEDAGPISWQDLRRLIQLHGLRNSERLAPMPTASTAQLLGNTESIEPITSNVYVRRVKAGEFVVVNRQLVDDLVALGVWDRRVQRLLVQAKGSVQAFAWLPQELRDVYRTVWEIPQRLVIDFAVMRAPFVDQSQSLNLYFTAPSRHRLTMAHFYAWNSGLKTGMYYLRSKAAVEPIQFTVEQQPEQATPARNERADTKPSCDAVDPSSSSSSSADVPPRANDDENTSPSPTTGGGIGAQAICSSRPRRRRLAAERSARRQRFNDDDDDDDDNDVTQDSCACCEA